MDDERAARIAEALRQAGYQALLCRLSENVVMLTGYLPVLGNSFCLVSLNASGGVECRLAVPKDEADLVPTGAAVEIKSFTEETLEHIGDTLEAVRAPLSDLLRVAGIAPGRGAVGYEGGGAPVATGYTQVGVPGPATLELYRALLRGVTLQDATPLLAEIGAIKTAAEVAAIKVSVDVAHQGFIAARSAIRLGATEAEVAAATIEALTRAAYRHTRRGRALLHVHVMAGARAAEAYRAFNLTTEANIARGETVLVQMEVGIDGYWAELTRTFLAGEASEEWARAATGCVAAQDAALAVIRDGALGRDADGAARRVMAGAGFGAAFKHGLGHGVGFQAINHGAAPILHPVSDAVLRPGMVHNLEPAVYLEGRGGLRLNDNVSIDADGAELLSAAIPRDLHWLVVPA